MLENLLLIAHLVLTVSIIVLVLLQQGKGAQAGAAFGGGSSQSLFGARGSANFLTRATSAAVIMFFATTLVLAYVYTHRSGGGSVVKGDVLSGSVLSGTVAEDAADNTNGDDPEKTVYSVKEVVTGEKMDVSDVPQIPADEGVNTPAAEEVDPQSDVPQVEAATDGDVPAVPE